MAHHPLDGVRAKLDRADKHLAFLQTKIRAYFETTPYEFVTKIDAGHGHPGAILHVTTQPSMSLSTIIGDVVHNTRSSLDYIVRELVVRNGKEPTFQTQFPICETAKAFQDEAVGKKCLRGVAPEAFDLIQKLQPFSFDFGDHPHALWVLQKLSNIDKHRTLNLAVLGVTARLDYIAADGHRIRTDHIEKPVYDGEVLHTMPKHFIDENVRVTGNLMPHLAFQDSPVTGIGVVGGLEDVSLYVRKVVLVNLERFFDRPPASDAEVTNRGS